MLGGVALLVFAVLFLRLWSLQVLSGDEYLNAAQNNQLRLVRVEAPRGPILDRHGRAIVSNVAGTAVRLWIGDMPKEGRHELVQRLAQVLKVPTRALAREVDEGLEDPLTPITVKTSVGEEQVNYLYEHQAEFPGVEIAQIYLATTSTTRSQLTSSAMWGRSRRRSSSGFGARAIAREIGSGRPASRGRSTPYLRGEDGRAQIRVDSLGNQVSDIELRREPRAGYALRLTLDIRLQRAAEEALRYGIDLAHETDNWAANGGAIVALDPRDGAVLAMASAPTYKPSVYVGRVDPKKLEPLLLEEAAARANSPGLNRALAGLYPPGSTWKPVTALAGMQEHVFSAYESLQCSPVAYYGLDRQRFQNWNPYVDRPMTLAEALAESCDTYFYEIGDRFYQRGKDGRTRMQQWARRFGFGAPTGLDIGGEEAGSAPDSRLALEDLRKRLGSRLEPGRLDPALDRPEGPARDTAPDGGVLRDARQRRGRRHAACRLGRRAARRERARHGSSFAALRHSLAVAPASTRARSAPSVTASTWQPIRRVGRPRASSPTTPCRSRARREPPRRSCSYPAIRATISRISRGGAGGALRTTPRSSSAR